MNKIFQHCPSLLPYEIIRYAKKVNKYKNILSWDSGK